MGYRTSVESHPDTCYLSYRRHVANHGSGTGVSRQGVSDAQSSAFTAVSLMAGFEAVGMALQQVAYRADGNGRQYAHDPFPRRGKIGTHRNAHPIWYTPTVLDYFRRHGLPVPEAVEFSV
jgi:hypothetical protein